MDSAEQRLESKEPRLKCRYTIALLGFMVFFILNGYRMNMSVGIVAMVNNSALSEKTNIKLYSCPGFLINTTDGGNSSEDEYHARTGEFNWSPVIQGHILGSYYLIYVILLIPFGKLVERYGCRWFLIWGTALAAVSTIAIPVASRLHAYALIFVQLLRALGQASYPSALSLMTANWFPKMERGHLFTFMLSGSSAGIALGSTLSGLLCKSTLLGGWPLSFYAFGVAGLVLSAAIACLMHETPDDHPKISQEEFKYITSNQENVLSRRRPNLPWRNMIRSVPVYALTAGYFGQVWAISQFMVVNSIFLGTILHYPIEQNGFFSAVPFLLMFLCSLISSWLSSVMVECVSVDKIRKFWNSVACLGCSACSLGLYLAGCNRSWSIFCSVLSMGFAGFGTSGSWIVSTDMTPTFAASLNAICSAFGCLPLFILPLVVGYLTNDMQTIEQWNKVFFVAIGVVMASGIIFLIFGSAEIQPWNDVEDTQKQKKHKTSRF